MRPFLRSARSPAGPAAAGHLRDGTPVRVRPLVPGDRASLVQGFGELSETARYARFLRPVSEAAYERMLPVLLDAVDQQAHIALVLQAGETPIGVGRVVRSRTDPMVADLAVTVRQEWQGRGAGGLLARAVLDAAGDVREIHTVVAEDNAPSLRMLSRLGALTTECAGGFCDVVVRLDRPAATSAA